MADLLKLPTLATTKAMMEAAKQAKGKAKTTDTLMRMVAVKLSKVIPIDEYKRIRMVNTLSAAGLSETPELFTASAIVKAGSIGLLAIPCLVALPLLAPVVLFLAILIYFKEIRKADEALSKKRTQIEIELPRFVATITQELKASRDVLSMLESYKQNAGDTFASELDILTADMRSSSYEASLTRFEARFNSPMLSDITRGLISVLRGDDGVVYFQMLSHDMKQMELQKLKAQVMKIPPKIRIFSFIMLMCFMLTYMAIIVYEIITSLSGMF
ncbi:secretion protein F [Bengtsoniella intestinalis]|uniref:secretion protein F n=1 Tax=Bengtsoniella intestinalis TaxID=3073143 RepID=UPI00391F5512